ncbi:hypothetical protein ACOME3_007104 [Neoechinorhynchus agilis]
MANAIFADNGFKRKEIMRFHRLCDSRERSGGMIVHGIDMEENRFSGFYISVKSSLVMFESCCGDRGWMSGLFTEAYLHLGKSGRELNTINRRKHVQHRSWPTKFDLHS